MSNIDSTNNEPLPQFEVAFDQVDVSAARNVPELNRHYHLMDRNGLSSPEEKAALAALMANGAEARKEAAVPHFREAGIVDVLSTAGQATHLVIPVPWEMHAAGLEYMAGMDLMAGRPPRPLPTGGSSLGDTVALPLEWFQRDGVAGPISESEVKRVVWSDVVDRMIKAPGRTPCSIPAGIDLERGKVFASSFARLAQEATDLWGPGKRDIAYPKADDFLLEFNEQFAELSRNCLSKEQGDCYFTAFRDLLNKPKFQFTVDEIRSIANTIKGIDMVESWIDWSKTPNLSAIEFTKACLEFGAFKHLFSFSDEAGNKVRREQFGNRDLIGTLNAEDLMTLMGTISQTLAEGKQGRYTDPEVEPKLKLAYLAVSLRSQLESGLNPSDACLELEGLRKELRKEDVLELLTEFRPQTWQQVTQLFGTFEASIDPYGDEVEKLVDNYREMLRWASGGQGAQADLWSAMESWRLVLQRATFEGVELEVSNIFFASSSIDSAAFLPDTDVWKGAMDLIFDGFSQVLDTQEYFDAADDNFERPYFQLAPKIYFNLFTSPPDDAEFSQVLASLGSALLRTQMFNNTPVHKLVDSLISTGPYTPSEIRQALDELRAQS